MGNFWYLFAAYAFVWGAVLAYIWNIAQRQRGLERDIEALEQAVRTKPDVSS